MEMRGMTTTKSVEQASKRQVRNQGFADGLSGQERRRREPEYLDGYRRGLEKRTRETAA